MSIAGGLFNSNNKEEKAADTKETADGDATEATAAPVDLTTSLPGFEDDADEGLLIETGGDFGDVEGGAGEGTGNVDVEGVISGDAEADFDFDVDAAQDVRFDPES